MPESKLAVYARLREAVLTTNEPVRALCASEGVSFQAFYKHARRRGWALRQPGRQRPAPRDALGKLGLKVETILAALVGASPKAPLTNAQTARLMARCAATLKRMQALEAAREKQHTVNRPEKSGRAINGQ